jgi:uncharacterized membrane protein
VTTIRSGRERLIQTLWFEALGVLVIGPGFAWFTTTPAGESLAVVATLSIAVMGWAAFYNTAYDLVERRTTGRVASDRPQAWRVLHAAGLEVTAVVVTWPLIVALTSLGWLDALVAEVGLTLAYAVYGYFFHLGFDRLRPVRGPASTGRSTETLS